MALIVGILVAAGGITAAGWGLFAYNEVTKIDRTNPKVVAAEYLQAALVRKDKTGADLYACADQTKLAPIRALRDDLDRREKEFGVTMVVSWGAFDQSGDSLTTGVTITAIANGQTQGRQTDQWRFDLKDEDGWRVCGAEKLAAQPTATATPTTAH